MFLEIYLTGYVISSAILIYVKSETLKEEIDSYYWAETAENKLKKYSERYLGGVILFSLIVCIAWPFGVINIASKRLAKYLARNMFKD